MAFRIFVAYNDKLDCGSTGYYDAVSDSCKPCQAPCESCTGPTTCTWCQKYYVYVESDNTCLDSPFAAPVPPCPIGTFKDAYLKYCKKCP